MKVCFRRFGFWVITLLFLEIGLAHGQLAMDEAKSLTDQIGSLIQAGKFDEARFLNFKLGELAEKSKTDFGPAFPQVKHDWSAFEAVISERKGDFVNAACAQRAANLWVASPDGEKKLQEYMTKAQTPQQPQPQPQTPPPTGGNPAFLQYVNNMNRAVQEIANQGRWDEALTLNQRIRFEMMANQQLFPNRDEFQKNVVNSFQFEGQTLEKVGYYQGAANAYMGQGKFQGTGEVAAKIAECQRKDQMQGEYSNSKMAYMANLVNMNSAILDLNRQKESLIMGMQNRSNPLTREDLLGLQNKLRDIEKRLTEQTLGLTKMKEFFDQKLAPFLREGINLRNEQTKPIEQAAFNLNRIGTEINQVRDRAQVGLVTIFQTSPYGWKGLDQNFQKLLPLQSSMRGLMDKTRALTMKKTLSDADRKALMELQGQLDKMIADFKAGMDQMEQSFRDALGFDQMPPDRLKAYSQMFDFLKNSWASIQSVSSSVIAAVKDALKVKYGDLNGDGVVNQKDLDIMSSFIARRDASNPNQVAGTAFAKYLLGSGLSTNALVPASMGNIIGDVDGDGQIGWSDFYLIRDSVYGNRKIFPVDPASIPGDIDGDGKITWNDARRAFVQSWGGFTVSIPLPKNYVSSQLVWDPKYGGKSAWTKILDLNGDGKCDQNDIKVIQQKAALPSTITIPTPPPTPPIASAPRHTPTPQPISGAGQPPASISNVLPASGTTTGVVHTTPSTGDAKSATGLENAF